MHKQLLCTTGQNRDLPEPASYYINRMYLALSNGVRSVAGKPLLCKVRYPDSFFASHECNVANAVMNDFWPTISHFLFDALSNDYPQE